MILLATTRGVPPWDSATASLAKSRLTLFSYLRSRKLLDEVALLTLFRDYSLIRHVHEDAFGNEIYHGYFSWLKRMGVKAFFAYGVDPDVYARRAQLVLSMCLNKVLHEVGSRLLLWCTGFTPIVPYSWISVVYEHYALDERYDLLKGFLMKRFTHVATSKTIASKLLRHGVKVLYLPPAVDSYYEDDHEGSRQDLEWFTPYVEGADIKLLYMGPLIPERFPVNLVIPLFLTLKRAQVNAIMVAITTVRNRLSLVYYKRLLQLIKRYELESNLILKLRVLRNDYIKRLVYEKFDVLLYIPVKPVEMSDPPLTVLEAMNSGLPPVISPIGDLAHLVKVYEAGAVTHLTPLNLYKSVRSIIENQEVYSENARRLVREWYSIEAVAERLEALLDIIIEGRRL